MATARLFISTDMQMITGVNHTAGDKDDVQSLVHALMYQDKFDIVGIASSTSWWQPGANNESFIHHVIDKYGQEQSVLAQHGDGFKSASALHDITYQGTQALAGASGIPDRTEASDAIIQQAREADAAGEKLYVATWGGLGDMARALHDAPEIAGAVRLLSVAGEQQEPNAYKYVLENFAGKGDLWWVNENSTHFGVYATPESTGSEQTDPAGNIWAETNARGHGVLGQFFYENTLDILGTNYPGDGLKMGDSHTVFYLIDGEANNDDPTSGSWGGEFQQAGDKYWID
ncbi:nucleoside hydrolase-like domain-containing protein [Paeniroseomonas aquatica]|uniref:DUF1593 domain-containing protein n=1 Tax=Paeniroseomonas aquatica TaxID=373043 RepID=A0ABT8A474_9PROT|nr:nucleoside hydrolase-like domain-containing protein [Paeniroseomonas aquatica]MDN3564166.1 DUF1593 domain-containing protein [Paeniroseomonas aquatica]